MVEKDAKISAMEKEKEEMLAAMAFKDEQVCATAISPLPHQCPSLDECCVTFTRLDIHVWRLSSKKQQNLSIVYSSNFYAPRVRLTTSSRRILKG